MWGACFLIMDTVAGVIYGKDKAKKRSEGNRELGLILLNEAWYSCF